MEKHQITQKKTYVCNVQSVKECVRKCKVFIIFYDKFISFNYDKHEIFQ